MRRPKQDPPLKVRVYRANAPDWRERYIGAMTKVIPQLRSDQPPDVERKDERNQAASR
jgi:hypothetical protein